MRKVDKPWGYEEIWAECERYAGKFLYINPGQKLSRQYHERKEETISVLEGVLRLEIGHEHMPEVRYLYPGDSYHVTPGTIHRFGAGADRVKLVEVSTPELDDVVRLQDEYDRVQN